MSADCCPEPVAGPVVGTRVLRHAWTALGPLRRGSWPAACSLEPGGRRETLAVLAGVLAGLYLAVDADDRLRWLVFLGQAADRSRWTRPFRSDHLADQMKMAATWSPAR